MTRTAQAKPLQAHGQPEATESRARRDRLTCVDLARRRGVVVARGPGRGSLFGDPLPRKPLGPARRQNDGQKT